uniref:Uncharacterized protein n=1 Tax=Ditylum brightwellii TaxID=49249 RepID=A0A7S4T0E4_9STRA
MLSPKCLIALLALTTVASAVDVEVNKIPVENVEQSEVEQSHRRVKGAKSGRFRHGRGRRHRPNYYYHPYKPTFEYREECVLTACIEFYYDLPDHPDHDDGHRELWPLTHSWKPSGSAGKVNLFYKKGHGYGTWNDDHTGHFGGSSDFSFDYDLHGKNEHCRTVARYVRISFFCLSLSDQTSPLNPPTEKSRQVSRPILMEG